MNSIGKYLEHTIVGVEMHDDVKCIHYLAYSYEADTPETPYRFVEYTFFITPLAEALEEGVVNFELREEPFIKQYVTDATAEELVKIYQHYDNGEEPAELIITELDMDTPCGVYRLEY